MTMCRYKQFSTKLNQKQTKNKQSIRHFKEEHMEGDRGKALEKPGANQRQDKSAQGADYKPLLTRETKGNNASTRQKHGVRMANATGLSWSLPIMEDTM